MTLEEFNLLTEAQQSANPYWRRGQTAFNVAYKLFGGEINNVIGTEQDPFNKDTNLPAFIKFLLKRAFLT